MKRLLVLLMLTMQSVVGIFAAVIHPYDVAAKNKEGLFSSRFDFKPAEA